MTDDELLALIDLLTAHCTRTVIYHKFKRIGHDYHDCDIDEYFENHPKLICILQSYDGSGILSYVVIMQNGDYICSK